MTCGTGAGDGKKAVFDLTDQNVAYTRSPHRVHFEETRLVVPSDS